jgi:hypothetical protein
MIADILTCVLTGSVGVGVGLVINTVRARAKRKLADSTPASSPPPSASSDVSISAKKKSRTDPMDGFQHHFDTMDKYIDPDAREEVHARVSIHKHFGRILACIEKSKTSTTKTKYWSPGGAIAPNAAKVKLWIRTIDHLFRARMAAPPDDLVATLQFLIDYVKTEQYNTLLG